MEQNKKTFPSEEVTLPSRGLLYPKDHPLSKGIVEIKYMTAREEDILTNQNFIKNGTVIDKLLQSLIVTKFDYKEQEVTLDLSEIKDREFDDSLIANKDNPNEFEYTLPFSKKQVTFKFLTHGDDRKIDTEIKGLKKISKTKNVENVTRWKHVILSIDGDYTKNTVREFVDSQFLARDTREFRNYINQIQPNVDLEVDLELPDGTLQEGVTLPIGVKFFWPDVEI